ncbi:MAG: hypothetical protein ACYSUM_24505 [Planctomycetota bacterium]|jgi:hypothetical protein
MVKTELLRRAARTAPTEANVVGYTQALFEIPCPDHVVQPGHDTPGEHLRAMWRGDGSTVSIASRGSYKTLVTAGGEFVLALHRGLHILHFAQYESQSSQAWRYIAEFAAKPWFEGLVEVTRTMVSFPKSGGQIEFRPLTLANARSAHVPVVVFDEADEMDPQILQIARFTTGTRDGEPARTHYVSTQNHVGGIIERLLGLAPERGVRVLRWNFKETTERCPDERSGTTPVEAWIHPKWLLHRVDRPADAPDWKRIEVFDGCLGCPLIASCRGDLKRARGTVSIQILLDQRNDPNYAPHVWRSQMDNEAPSSEGSAVPEWDPELSVTEAADYDPELPVYLGVDFGTVHPAAVVIAQQIPVGHKGNRVRGRKHIFAEYSAPATFYPVIIDWIAEHWIPKYGFPKRAWIDPSGAPVANRVPLAGRTLLLEKALSNKHKVGYDALRGHAVPTDEDGKPKLLVHPRCERLIHEIATVRHVMHDKRIGLSPEEQREAVERVMHGGWG